MGNPIKFSRETFQWIKQNEYVAKTQVKIEIDRLRLVLD